MNKNTSNIIVILLAIAILVFLFWLLFLRDQPQSNNPSNKPKSENTTTDTSNTTNTPSTPVDATSDQLTATENKELQTFLHDFTQKYISYDQSKPTANVERVKELMTPDLYQEQFQYYQAPLPVKNVKVRNIRIDSIDVEDRMTTTEVKIDVTIVISDHEQKNMTYSYSFVLYDEQSGWKVGYISDDTTEN